MLDMAGGAAVDELDSGGGSGGGDAGTPVWAVFGDLMASLLGAFVLMLVCVLAVQMELATSLAAEVQQRQLAQQQRLSLESSLAGALAGPLASGRVTLNNGRIGISGSLLFALNSDQLQPEGRQLLKSLAAPLVAYLGSRDELLMVSGFTDDRPVRDSNAQFADNLELSAQRALTVTRALIEEGMPAAQLFAAAFGPEQPVAPNADAAGRAKNRRVEIAPVPRAGAAQPGITSPTARPAAEPASASPSTTGPAAPRPHG